MTGAITAAIIGLVGAAASAGVGAAGAKSAASAAGANVDAQAQAQTGNLAQALMQQNYQKSGQYGPLGNTIYKEGVGWISNPSAAANSAISNSLREELMRSGSDLPAQRVERQAGQDRRAEYATLAEAMMRKLQMDQGKYDMSTIGALSRLGDTSAINRAYDDSEQQTRRQLFREGTNPEAYARASGRERAQALREADLNNPLKILTQSLDLQGNVDAGDMNKMNQFNALASNYTDQPFIPSQLGQTFTNAMLARGSQPLPVAHMNPILTSANQQGYDAAGSGIGAISSIGMDLARAWGKGNAPYSGATPGNQSFGVGNVGPDTKQPNGGLF